MTQEQIFTISPITDQYIVALDLPEKIIHAVCKYFQVSPLLVKGETRKAVIAKARKYCLYFIWKFTDLESGAIVQYFNGRSKTGKRDRTIVSAAKRKIQSELRNSEKKVQFMLLSATVENLIHS